MMNDLEQIRQLKYRYLRTLDTKQWDDFADCFVPEATADYAGLAFPDREALVDYMRTNLGPAWLRWALFPHNVNYHVEHHLYASVPQHNLPALHSAMVKHGLLENAEVIPFRATLAKIFAERTATSASTETARTARAA